MIKRLLLICFLLFVFVGLKAQPYGNEWINYSQPYYKIKIFQNGVYRIDSATLAASGVPVATIKAQNFQLFNKGFEQKIYIQGESDSTLNATDYIEFYAEMNDGSLDSRVYVNTSFLPNPYYSLVNDTAVYFLTWNNSFSNARMSVENDTSFSSHAPDNFFWKDEVHDFHSDYYAGETDVVGGTDSRYTRSEGWFDINTIDIGNNNFYGSLVNTSNQYFGGPNAIINTVVVGASKDAHLISLGQKDHHLKIEFGPSNTVLADTLFFGYESNRFIKSVPLSELGATYTDFRYTSIADAAFTYNRTAVSYISLKYPHTFDLEGKTSFTMYVPDNGASQSYLDITNLTTSGAVHLYNLSTGSRINVVSGATHQALVLSTGLEKKCYITSDGYITNVNAVEPVTPTALFTDYANPLADSVYIIVTHKSLMTSATDYKNYRSSIAGGSYNVVLADIDQLYDQFGYGIVKSPLAIRGLTDYLIHANSVAPPKNLLLLGKSIHLYYSRWDPASYDGSLVPSFGYPSSDNLLTAGLNGTILSPAISTGRLSAKTNAEVYMYLNKIQQYESLTSPEEWMKYILHFGGGTTTGEQTLFKSYLNRYRDTIQNVKFGGTVIKDFFKNTSAPIEINSSDTLRDLINNGVAMMTFFGHASGTGFDQSIDDWSTYSPAPGHYPFLLANSCYAGDFHSPSGSSSETYTFINNNGVIGYLGSVGLGVPFALNVFSEEFYNELARKNYGKSVGSTIQKTIESIQAFAVGDTLTRETCYEMNLQGDPALVLHTQQKPDYKITNTDLFYDLTSDVDSFTVYAVRTNIGMAENDSIIDKLIRILPNGDSTFYYSNTKAPYYKDTVSFKLPIDFVNGVGLNKIIVSLDWFNVADESNETNNTTGLVDVFINGGNVVPVYPYEFAIIPKDTITLKASTANLFAAAKNYRFQLDTTDTYDSPLMKDTVIYSAGGVLSWKPNLTFIDSTVYFWRVSADSVDTTGYSWRESSFQYIHNKRGWEQAHFFQFKNDGYQYVKYNRPARRFDFANDVISLFASTGIVGYGTTGIEDITYKFNGYVRSVYTCLSWPQSGFTFVAINPITGIPITSQWVGLDVTTAVDTGTYGDYHCAHATWDAIEFKDINPIWQNRMATFLNNLAPGTLVLGYSEIVPQYSLYSPVLNNAFQHIGANNMNALQDSMPYIIWGVKSATPNPGTATEITTTSVADVAVLNTTFSTNWSDGYIASPVIGPAYSWDSLSWDYHTLDGAISSDSIHIKLIGIDAAGNETTLANFYNNMKDVPNLGTYVNAAIYPKIRLMAYKADDSLHTPPQLERWQVIYDPVPEAAINPLVGYTFPNTVLQEGDNIKVNLPIQNISEYPFTDSLLITYWIEDANRVNHPLPSKLKNPPFNSGQVILDSISINTASLQGDNALWVEVNPVNNVNSQLEQYHFNNIVRIPFHTNVDRINPLLDVTFDGIHILNNDIISAKPNILVQLKDENQFLALNDTNDFKVFIKAPSAAVAQRVFFGSNMSFIPAALPSNSCKINYTPVLAEDGTYQLLVQAKDRSDNMSGAIDYKINFEIVNHSSITEVMNYPNPFSTATRFVFTLTGSEVPTNFKVQIMTITGKVVREIYQDELGPLHVGRNITEFAWDGKDTFGDQLANGVYLYRVITQINGSDIEKRSTEADQYFKKGWGKMYLMR